MDKAVKLVIIGPKGAFMTAGHLSPFTIIAEEASGKVDKGDNQIFTLTSSDGQTVYPYRAIGLKKGRAIVRVALDKADSTTLVASEGPVTGTSRSFTVYAAAAASLSLASPSPETAGNAFPVTETAYDRYGNIATGYSGTATLTSSDGQQVSPSTLSFNPSSTTPGVATVGAHPSTRPARRP